MHQNDCHAHNGTIDSIDPLDSVLLSIIKMIERGPSTTKAECWLVSDRTLLLQPISGLLVLVQALGQAGQLAVITF